MLHPTSQSLGLFHLLLDVFFSNLFFKEDSEFLLPVYVAKSFEGFSQLLRYADAINGSRQRV